MFWSGTLGTFSFCHNMHHFGSCKVTHPQSPHSKVVCVVWDTIILNSSVQMWVFLMFDLLLIENNCSSSVKIQICWQKHIISLSMALCGLVAGIWVTPVSHGQFCSFWHQKWACSAVVYRMFTLHQSSSMKYLQISLNIFILSTSRTRYDLRNKYSGICNFRDTWEKSSGMILRLTVALLHLV